MIPEEDERPRGLDSMEDGLHVPVLTGTDKIAEHPDDTAARIRRVAEHLALGLTSRWSEATDDVKRLVLLEHDRVVGLSNELRNLSANLRAFRSGRESDYDPAGKFARGLNELFTRLALSEERSLETATVVRSVEREMRRSMELQEETRAQLVILQEAIARLESAVRANAERIESQVTDGGSHIAGRVDVIAGILNAQHDSIAALAAALPHIEEVQRSFEQRVEGQALAIQSIHSAAQSQTALWRDLRLAAASFEEAITTPANELSALSDVDLENL